MAKNPDLANMYHSKLNSMHAMEEQLKDTEAEMMKASQHFVGGNQPETFAKVVVECMDKCYPGEADLVVARAVLLYLSLGNLRDVNRLWDSVRQRLSDSSQELPDTPLLHLIKFLLLTCGTCYALSVVSLRCGAGQATGLGSPGRGWRGRDGGVENVGNDGNDGNRDAREGGAIMV
uniref:Predicted protein n=1 Tax=Physcomitrium patens TaxID=3218 RepID=A9U5E5_PHYPA